MEISFGSGVVGGERLEADFVVWSGEMRELQDGPGTSQSLEARLPVLAQDRTRVSTDEFLRRKSRMAVYTML